MTQSLSRAFKLISLFAFSTLLSACITQVATVPAQAASQSAQTAGQTAGQAAQAATGGEDDAKKIQRNNP